MIWLLARILKGSFGHMRNALPSPFSAVFLPAAGNRNGSSVNNVGSNGNYWSSTINSSNTNNAYNVNFNSGNFNATNNNNRYNGNSVRLVFTFAALTLSFQTNN